LVVDDERAIREIAGKILSGNGYRVLTAASGEEALEVFQKQPDRIAGVLMDLGMPGMGGKACLREILVRAPGTKVLVASGYLQFEHSDELKRLGVWGMVAKPYHKAELLRHLRDMLDD
jgi:CheY-like chemotaxis protein